MAAPLSTNRSAPPTRKNWPAPCFCRRICAARCWRKWPPSATRPPCSTCSPRCWAWPTVNPRGTCPGCAYRLGTPANTSPVTTSDAIYCRQELSRFYCHADLDDQGNPVRTCVGHAKAMKQDATK